MAQFDVTALTTGGPESGPLHIMPLLRKDIPIAKGHTLVLTLYPWLCPTGSTYNITSAQAPCHRPTLCHSAQSWILCVPLFFGTM